jgi:hypothetical protein
MEHEMEIGSYPIPHRNSYQNAFSKLFYYEKNGRTEYRFDTNGEFENDVFSYFPYYWGDCTCGCDEDTNDDATHDAQCLLIKPNFVHKPSGLEIQWYKYALRDSYTNRGINLDELKKIVSECVKSLKHNKGENNE